MDKLDKSILGLLQEGNYCVPKLIKIARKLGEPVSTIRDRIARLETNKIIDSYTPSINSQKAGFNITSFVQGKFDQGVDPENVMKEILKIPYVQEAHWTVGGPDFMLRLTVRDEDEYYKMASKMFIPIKGITQLTGLRISHTYRESKKLNFESLPAEKK